jgi:hypothetical protein
MQVTITSRTETRAKVAHELTFSSQELLDLYRTADALLEALEADTEPATEERTFQIATLQAFLAPYTMEKEKELLAFIAEESGWSNA